MSIKVGDVVGRKSYNKDVYFKVVEIRESSKALLKGLEMRIIADAPLDDLVKLSNQEIREYKKKYIKQTNECLRKIFERRQKSMKMRGISYNLMEDNGSFFDRPGKVLHIDADENYLEMCLNTYKQLKIKAVGIHASEKDHPRIVKPLLQKHYPDILVVTGHDGMLNNNKNFTDLNSYRHSRYFVEAVRKAREFEPSLDDLVIFAGACQSYYEALLKAGANFASSPHRVLIHALDPIFIVEKVAFEPIDKIIRIHDVISSTITGIKGIGGFETRGKFREGLPRSPYE